MALTPKVNLSYIVLGVVTILVLTNLTASDPTKSVQELLDKITKNYEKGIRPNYGGKPVEVGVTAYIVKVEDIDEREMEFTVTLFFRQFWTDPRLAFSGEDRVSLLGDHAKSIWEPDTFVPNEVRSSLHEFGGPNKNTRVSPNGTIRTSSMYTITASCPMDLEHFPFDQQICQLEFESYSYSAEDIVYNWDKGHAASVGLGLSSTPTFRILGHQLLSIQANLSTRNYSRLTLHLLLERSSGRYFTRYFIPMMLFVGVSLVSGFILSPRIGAVVNFLNIGFINLFMAEGGPELPAVSFNTGLDVFYYICILHIILALVDSLIAAYFEKSKKGTNEMIEMTSRRPVSEDAENLCSTRPALSRTTSVRSAFEFIFRFLRPAIVLLFLFCNIVFWFYIVHTPKLSDSDYAKDLIHSI